MIKCINIVYLKKALAIVVCICFVEILWLNSKNAQYADLNMDLSLKTSNVFYEKSPQRLLNDIRSPRVFLYNSPHFKIAQKAVCQDGYLRDYYLYLLVQTDGYSDVKCNIYYELPLQCGEYHKYSCDVKKGSYTPLQSEQAEITSMGPDSIHWEIKNSVFSEAKWQIYTFYFYTVSRDDIPEKNRKNVIKKFRFLIQAV